MTPEIIEAKHTKAFTIHVRFSDGTKGDIDLSDELYGEVFEPLKDAEVFKNFTVHPEFHTIC